MKFIFNLIFLWTIISGQILEDTSGEDTWEGKWFPNIPGQEDKNIHERIVMGVANASCDDGETNLATDFDPKALQHQAVYLCCEDVKLYQPNVNTNPIISEYQIPPLYIPQHICMNDTIEYEELLPTYGKHRPLWPIYGEYLYVPVQRWLHSLEHGAIVALYHPCSNGGQVNRLKSLVRSCLRRHVISPSQSVTKERPFALLGWGRRLEFSVVDETIVTNFIKESALKGPELVSRDGQYGHLLVEAAKIISDIDDSVLCPNSV